MPSEIKLYDLVEVKNPVAVAADDRMGSGAKYTIGHEQRSIDFMRNYLSEKRFPANTIEDCTHLIMCTNLNLRLQEIPFRTPEIETLGKIVG